MTNKLGPSDETPFILQGNNAIPRYEGITLYGSTLPNGNLNLDSTTNSTKGSIIMNSEITVDHGITDQYITTAIPFSETGITGLDSVNASSIIGSINENNEATRLLNGMMFNDTTITVTSDGTNVSVNLDRNPTGILTVKIGDDILTTSTISHVITTGTDSAPVLVYIWVYNLAGVVTIEHSTTGWPLTPMARLCTILAQSAASIQTYGVYKFHKWDDHPSNSTVNTSHINHNNLWIRNQPATWISGCIPNVTITGISISSGTILQLHPHTMPARDTTSDGAYVINDFTTKYNRITDIQNIVLDSLGASLNNKYFTLVFYGIVSEDATDCKINISVSSGYYNSITNAQKDEFKYTNTNIPDEYKGTGFLIAKAIYRLSGGVYTKYDVTDLRGTIPNTGVSGGGSLSGSSFSDENFNIFDNTDDSKIVQFECSGIDPSTTRELTVPNKDGTIALLSDIITSSTYWTRTGTELSPTTQGDNISIDRVDSTGLAALYYKTTTAYKWLVGMRNDSTNDWVVYNYANNRNVIKIPEGTNYVHISTGIAVNTINEYTSGSGITIDSVLLKDGVISTVGAGNTFSNTLGGELLRLINTTNSDTSATDIGIYNTVGGVPNRLGRIGNVTNQGIIIESDDYDAYIRVKTTGTVLMQNTDLTGIANFSSVVGQTKIYGIQSYNVTGKVVGVSSSDKIGYITDISVDTVTATTLYGNLITDSILEKTLGNGVFIEQAHIIDDVVASDRMVCDSLDEKTIDSGVTIEGMLHKDSILYTDTIDESTSATGVTIDGTLFKDNVMTLTGTSNSGIYLDRSGTAGYNGIVYQTATTWNIYMGHAASTNWGIYNGAISLYYLLITTTGIMYLSTATYGNLMTGARDLHIGGTGQIGYQTSLRKAKTNIEDYTKAESDKLYSLRVRKYNYREKIEDTNSFSDTEYFPYKQIGLIAEETAIIDPDLTVSDWVKNSSNNWTKGNLCGVNNKDIQGMMLKCIQEQKKEIDQLKSDLNTVIQRLNSAGL